MIIKTIQKMSVLIIEANAHLVEEILELLSAISLILIIIEIVKIMYFYPIFLTDYQILLDLSILLPTQTLLPKNCGI